MARPTKFSPEIAQRILSFVRLGHTASAASEACGIAPRTLRAWLLKGRKEPESYPELAEFVPRFLEADGAGIIEFERRAIADGKMSGELALKILERRRWRDWGQQGWRVRQQEKEILELRKEIEELKALIVAGRSGSEA